MPLDLEDVLLFLDGLRLDHQRRHALVEGIVLMREAVSAGLMPDLGQPWEFRQRVIEARDIGWITWTPAPHDGWGDDLRNAPNFMLTDSGLRHAQELKEFPKRRRVGRWPDVLGRQRLQGRARRRVRDDTVIQIWSKNHLIKTVARARTGPVRKVRADGLHVKHQPNTNRQASAGT